MGILCKAVITDRVEIFEVWEISAGDKKCDEVLGELKTTWLCRADDNSLSWGKQPLDELVRLEAVVKTGKDENGSVPTDRTILTRADYCGALFTMPAGNQLQFNASPFPGHTAPSGACDDFLSQTSLPNLHVGKQMMLAEMINSYLVNYHELN